MKELCKKIAALKRHMWPSYLGIVNDNPVGVVISNKILTHIRNKQA